MNITSKLYPAAIACIMASTPLAAETFCAPRDVVVRVLADPMGHARKTQGLDAAGNLVEVWAADDGAWTLTLTNAGGTTCVLGEGELFEYVNEPLPPLGQDG